MRIGLKLRISQTIWQGNVKNGHMYTNPSTKYFPAMHNLWKNVHKILDKKYDIMQKTTYFLEQFSIIYEF
jgi:hypothetical protein